MLRLASAVLRGAAHTAARSRHLLHAPPLPLRNLARQAHRQHAAAGAGVTPRRGVATLSSASRQSGRAGSKAALAVLGGALLGASLLVQKTHAAESEKKEDAHAAAHDEHEKEEEPEDKPPHPDQVLLSPSEFKQVTVLRESTNGMGNATYIVLGGSPSKDGSIPVTSFYLIKAIIDGKTVIRPYTPVHTSETASLLVVKKYPNGPMSQHIAGLKPGDTVEVKGPIPKLQYKPNMKKKIIMLAGGSGITPMFQVMSAISSNKDDKTDVVVLYGSRSPSDLLLATEVEYMMRTLSKRKSKDANGSKLVYFFEIPESELPKNMDGVHSGRISKDFIQKYAGAPDDDTIVLICGPDQMLESLSGKKAPDYSQGELSGVLKDLGWTSQQVYKF